jgi:hypothetical protein
MVHLRGLRLRWLCWRYMKKSDVHQSSALSGIMVQKQILPLDLLQQKKNGNVVVR